VTQTRGRVAIFFFLHGEIHHGYPSLRGKRGVMPDSYQAKTPWWPSSRLIREAPGPVYALYRDLPTHPPSPPSFPKGDGGSECEGGGPILTICQGGEGESTRPYRDALNPSPPRRHQPMGGVAGPPSNIAPHFKPLIGQQVPPHLPAAIRAEEAAVHARLTAGGGRKLRLLGPLFLLLIGSASGSSSLLSSSASFSAITSSQKEATAPQISSLSVTASIKIGSGGMVRSSSPAPGPTGPASSLLSPGSPPGS